MSSAEIADTSAIHAVTSSRNVVGGANGWLNEQLARSRSDGAQLTHHRGTNGAVAGAEESAVAEWNETGASVFGRFSTRGGGSEQPAGASRHAYLRGDSVIT